MNPRVNNPYQFKTCRSTRSGINALIVAFLVCGAAFATYAQDIISFDIVTGVQGTDPNWMNPQTDAAGAPGVWTNQWNFVSTNVSFNMGYTTDLTDIVLPPGTITNELGNVVPNQEQSIVSARRSG